MPERKRTRRELAKRFAAGVSTPPPNLDVEDVGPPEDGWVLLSVETPSLVAPDLPAALGDVLARVLRGESNRTIATKRGTSLRTVENQIAILLRRFGARSRVDLARLALGAEAKKRAAGNAPRSPRRSRTSR